VSNLFFKSLLKLLKEPKAFDRIESGESYILDFVDRKGPK
jgi:hypothetical protein